MARIKKLFLEDYLFKGRYTDMVNDLTQVIDQTSGAQIFNSVVELYMMSAIVGAYYQKTADPEPGDTTKRIMSSQFTNRYDDLMFIYRLVMLNVDRDTADPIDRINNAFRYSNDDPEFQANIDVFEKYMLGGLTILHNKFIKSTNTHFDDYRLSLNEMIEEMSDNVDFEDLDDDIDFGPML